MWGELDWQFMTDESSGDDENCLYQHHLPWHLKGDCIVVIWPLHSLMFVEIVLQPCPLCH